jgi:hypothetical protein
LCEDFISEDGKKLAGAQFKLQSLGQHIFMIIEAFGTGLGQQIRLNYSKELSLFPDANLQKLKSFVNSSNDHFFMLQKSSSDIILIRNESQEWTHGIVNVICQEKSDSSIVDYDFVDGMFLLVLIKGKFNFLVICV